MGQTILTPQQRRILEQVSSNAYLTQHYFLTGGTALSEYYFQHRLSEDLDFFTEQKLEPTPVLSWAKETSLLLKSEVSFQSLHGQLIFVFSFPESDVKVEFAYYPFPHLGEFVKDNSIRIASVLDIGVNKLQAIQTRKRGRDFFDLFTILNSGQLSWEQLLQNYRNKFDLIMTPQELAKHLVGVTEASDQPRFLKLVDWEELENYFLDLAKKLGASFLR